MVPYTASFDTITTGLTVGMVVHSEIGNGQNDDSSISSRDTNPHGGVDDGKVLALEVLFARKGSFSLGQ